MATKYVTAPCVIHIVSTATYTWKTKYVAKEGAQGTTPHAKKKKKERRTATHVKRHARKHKPQPYIPHIYSSIGPDRREKKKKKFHKSAKGMGRPQTKGKQGKGEQANVHQPRGNNGTASKYVNDTREGAKGTDHAHTHTHKQDRNEREDGDRSKEKQGMNPTPPRPQTHTRSRYRE